MGKDSWICLETVAEYKGMEKIAKGQSMDI